MKSVSLNLKKEIQLKNPTIIIGFPGVGLVGSIAVSYLVDNLGFEFGGYFSSLAFAPLAAVHDYKPLPPVRLYFSKNRNIVAVLSEMIIPMETTHALAEEIEKLAKELGGTQIISLGGITLKEGEKVYVISTDKDMLKEITTKKIATPIREGATSGVGGLLLCEGMVKNYPVVSFLAEANPDFPDPHAASNVLKTLSRFLGFEVNTAQLEKEAKLLSGSLKEVVIKSKVEKKKPSGGMYG